MQENGHIPETALADAADRNGWCLPRALLLHPPNDDRPVELGVPQIQRIDPVDQLLWISITFDPGEIELAAMTLGESPQDIARLMAWNDRPRFRDQGELSAISVRVPLTKPEGECAVTTCAIGQGWVITAQETDADALKRFREHVRTSGWLGALDSASFAGLLLDWLFNEYRGAFEQLEEAVDAFDSAVLAGDLDNSERAVSILVDLRRRVTRLRRILCAHRDLELWISHAAEHHLVSQNALLHLQRIGPRMEQALLAADTTRDSINGSFALLMSTAADRTNGIIRVLTVVSVTLLPATLVAGIMGMNFHPGFFDHPSLFWGVVGLMSALIGTALVLARRERWI
jgi:magnesium transporter